jgi:tRNA pseudouridine55 synthase
MNGILSLNKPASISSARAVDQVKRLLPRGTKIGHAGTLDPFATGVLLLLIGRATKLCETLMDEQKQYRAAVRLGSTTATDDSTSPPIAWQRRTHVAPPPSLGDLSTILQAYKGRVMQKPPIFSALKVAGQRAYKLARSDIVPELAPRPVTIYDIEVIDFAWPLLQLRIDCGRGTYIRALARDIGADLDVGGHLTQLCRTRIGPFHLDSAATLADLRAADIADKLTPIEKFLEQKSQLTESPK